MSSLMVLHAGQLAVPTARHTSKRKKTLTLKMPLGDLGFTVLLSSYINSTKHFKQNSGEHTQT